MKKFKMILIGVVLAFASFAQSQLTMVKQRVGDMTAVSNWKVGEVKEAYNVKVLRTEGENGIDHRTNVLYIPQSKLLAEVNQLSAVEPVYNKEYDELVDFYTNQYPGGQVAIFFDRISQTLANPANFTVMVIDPKTNKEVYREKLEHQMPYSYKWGIWYYYTVINIPEAVGEKLIVRVIDEGLQQSSEFLVYDNFPPAQMPASIVSAGK